MKAQPVLLFCLTTVITIAACKIYYKPQPVDYTLSTSSIKEGKRLTMLICADCHYNSETGRLTGMRMHDVPRMVGKVYSSNITKDADKGIGAYTDAELAYLLRTGIAKDGKLMPYMQRPNLAKADLDAIIAFLRSNDELVQPSSTEPPTTNYTFIGKLGISKFSKPLPWSTGMIDRPDAVKEKTAYGKYLVDNLGCYHCHSASFTKIDLNEPERSKRYMGGGQKMNDAAGRKIVAPNLTFHETGIAGWTEEEFSRAVKEGIDKNNTVITAPMPVYAELSDAEAAAIYSYLKTIPRIDNRVSRKKTVTANTGIALYTKYGCQSCHGANGTGQGNLRQVFSKYSEAQVRTYIDNPRSFGNKKMPAYAGIIKENDYRALIAYLKQLAQ